MTKKKKDTGQHFKKRRLGHWVDDRRGVGGRVEKMKDLRNTDWEFQSCHGDVRYSTGNIVNNTEITRYGARWVLEISGGTTS